MWLLTRSEGTCAKDVSEYIYKESANLYRKITHVCAEVDVGQCKASLKVLPGCKRMSYCSWREENATCLRH